MFGPDDFEVQIQQETPPGIHAEPSIPPAQDEEYGDFIVKHGQNMGWKISSCENCLEFYIFR